MVGVGSDGGAYSEMRLNPVMRVNQPHRLEGYYAGMAREEQREALGRGKAAKVWEDARKKMILSNTVGRERKKKLMLKHFRALLKMEHSRSGSDPDRPLPGGMH